DSNRFPSWYYSNGAAAVKLWWGCYQTSRNRARVCRIRQRQEKTEVPADTLNHILEQYKISPDQVAFVGSDTEGSEFRVIATGQQLWRAGVSLYVEVFPEALRLQNGLDEFLRQANQFFSRFIERADLIKDGIKAPRRPISEMAHLVDRLSENYKKGGVYISDVLLLPACFEN
ncbi:MAG: hypothetical protein ACRENG_26125, partial [bacterium]